MVKATLVLEGGANRGVFTSGVLDYLMEKDMYMSNVIGVSAGACNAVDYVSKQAGRSRECVIHREKEYDYVYGLKKTLKEKALMDMDMLFDKFPNEIYPFDFETYFASEMECELVVTNCITGDAEYLSEDKDAERLMKICRASSSMPLAAPIANVDGIPYMDGGLPMIPSPINPTFIFIHPFSFSLHMIVYFHNIVYTCSFPFGSVKYVVLFCF